MSSKPIRVLLVGQTPPPFHGQGIMMERLVNAPLGSVETQHVRMAFSRTIDDVGRLGIGKVVHLFHVIFKVVAARFTQGSQILYYPPAGPNRVPMWRDIAILFCTRWLFEQTVFHMQASGISDMYSQLGSVGKWFYRQAYFNPDAVIRLSEFNSDDANVLQAKREFIVPNCADDELNGYPDLHVERSNREEDSPTRLLYLSTVCRTKGILVLVAACKELLDEGVKFQLDVVGSFQPAEFEFEVRDAIQNAGLEDTVRICGQLTGTEKADAFAAADVFCFPSYYECESFGCVLVEAMSFGLPVVATRWRGIQSIVDNEETGFLTAIRDSTGFYLALKRLCADPRLRSQMGVSGRKKFEQEYTTGRHLEAMEFVLTSVGNRASL